MDETVFRGWYNRDYLPHFDTNKVPQMVTYRLADALPRDVVKRILNETDPDDAERYCRFEEMLDAGYGSCVLERPECAEIIVENLHYHAGERYRLLEWVVMPNHVHVVYDRPTCSLKTLMHGWKSYTSNEIKKRLSTFGDGESLWQAGFHDRYARDADHLKNMQGYVFFNPVKPGLVSDPFDWPYSSVHNHTAYRGSIMRWWRDKKERFWRHGRGD